MTLPRSTLIDPHSTPYYHCVSRCVRRAFLCGRDSVTGANFEHRRGWIEARLHYLAGVFAIDLCAYAVMSNHYHVVLRLDSARQREWTDSEVVERWGGLHHIPSWFAQGETLQVSETIATWRERLGSISWFMKELNEPLARMANREDDCKGRFWEGRFKSQALLDEAALLKCMAYVDLNPVRAGLVATPEDSAHTSIRARIRGRENALAPMADYSETAEYRLPVSRAEYLELVDWTGRQLRPGKRGRIAASTPPIVQRLQRSGRRDWLDEMSHLTRHYFRAIGDVVSLQAFRDHLGQERLKGLTG